MEMRNIRLTIEYDGTRYHGWQSVKGDGSSTISGRISNVLRQMTEEDIKIFCGEKTEPGVHALRQTVNFKTLSTMREEEIRHYLNRYLPLDIAVRDVAEESERFHAELNSRHITYKYRLTAGETEDVFQRKYVDCRKEMPDIEAMQNAGKLLIGNHDFRIFSAGKTKKSTVREITGLRITGDTSEINILLTANGFLKQMPQKMIGTLLDVGYGKRDADCIEKIFAGDEDVSVNCENRALFLVEINYDQAE